MNNLSSSPAEGFLPILRRVPLGLAVAVYVVIQSLWSVYGFNLSSHLTDLTTGRILYLVVILLYSLPFFAIVLSHSLTSRLGQVMGFVALGLFFVGELLLMLFPYNTFIQLAVVPMFVLCCIFSSSRYRLAWILLSAEVLIAVLSSLISNLFADKTLIYLGIVPFATIFRYAGLAAFLYLGLVSARPSSGRQPSLAGDALTKSALPRIFAIVSMVFLFFAMLLLVFTTMGDHIDERMSYSWYGESYLEFCFDRIIPWGLLLAVGYHFAVAAYLFLFMHHRSFGVKLTGMITMGLGLLLTVVVFFMVGVTLLDLVEPTPYKLVACLITLIFVVPLWLAKNGAEGTSRAVLSAVVAGLVVMAGSMLCMIEPQTYLTEIYDVNATNDFVFRLILPYLFLMTTMLAVAFPRLPRRWVFAIMAGFSFLIVMLNFASDIFN